MCPLWMFDGHYAYIYRGFMKVDKINLAGIYKSYLPDNVGRSVNTDGISISGFGYHEGVSGGTVIQGILCGSDTDSLGISNIRWLNNYERVVVHEGIVGLSTKDFTRLSDKVYVDSLGNLYNRLGEGRLVVSNATWLTEGNSPYLQIHGKYYVPKPSIYIPLTHNLDEFNW